ncbi:hypothetical protein FRB98_007146 [Tulasnella sp. 332]|nr:hypothetical protein FRB98_007146 [Tulasnella sp. 332]
MVHSTGIVGLLIVFSQGPLVFADVVPTAPGPGATFNEGSMCTLQWDVDTTDTWTDMTIDLMSGSNLNMTRVINLSVGANRTWPTWTTRFTIGSTNRLVTPPLFQSQPDGGPAIPWGEGALRSTNETNVALEEAELQTSIENSNDAVGISDDSRNEENDDADDDDSGDDSSDGLPDIVSSPTNTNGTLADSNLGQALKSDTLANFTMPSAEDPQSNPNATGAESQTTSTSYRPANSTASPDNKIPAPMPSTHRLYASSGYCYGGVLNRDILIVEIMTCVVMCLTLSMVVIGQ